MRSFLLMNPFVKRKLPIELTSIAVVLIIKHISSAATSSPPFLTRSVAGVQHYAQINQTVSEECDILVIQDIGAQWITSPETLF